MFPWDQRPIEIANLFNPAFCCILISDAIQSYENENRQGMSYSLVFLVLPIILHKATRDILPSIITTKMHVWLQAHPDVRVEFATRTQHLVPFTREALIYALNARTIQLTSEGILTRLPTPIKEPSWPRNSEPTIIRNKAQFIGRWFARSGDTSTIYIMWGIQP